MKKRRSRPANLEYERKLRGWSQAYVASHVFSDTRTVSRWERGESTPDAFHMQRLIELFGKNAQELGFLAERDGETSFDEELEANSWDWGEVPAIEGFYGREQELNMLKQWVLVDHCRLLLILGLGGMGKTTLATYLAREIQQAFTCICWSSLQHILPLRGLLEKWISLLSHREQRVLPENIDELIGIFLSYLQKQPALLILDNFESVMESGMATGEYIKAYEDYGKLLRRVGETIHPGCLIITSREKPGSISHLEGHTLSVRLMHLSGMDFSGIRDLLEYATLIGSEDDWRELARFYAGNPLALKVIAEYIREIFVSKIADFLKSEETVLGDISHFWEQQFQRLTPLEQEVLYWLAIEREPVSLAEIRSNFIHYIPGHALVESLHSLSRRFMIETSATGLFTLQPVIMEFVTERFVNRIGEEIETESLQLFLRYPLVKARVKDHIRNSQRHLILAPVVERLHISLGKEMSETKLKMMLLRLRSSEPLQGGYAAGNILNALVALRGDLRGMDFSHLPILQAYLRNVVLPQADFSHARFKDVVFTDTFGGILCVAFSPNGVWMAAGTTEGEIRLWQTDYERPYNTFLGHTDGVRSIAFTPDGLFLLSGSDDHTIRCWDVSTGSCLRILAGHTHAVRAVTCSTDGRILASASEDQTIRLWDINTGQCEQTLRGHQGWVRSVAFSPDGGMLASGSSDRTIRIWDCRTTRCLVVLQEHSQAVRAVVFDAMGGLLASCSDDESVRLWDTSTFACMAVIRGHIYPIRTVAFHPRVQLIASAGDDQTIRVSSTSTGRCLAILRGHTQRIWSIAFSPDGKMLASGGEDQAIRLWDIHTGSCLHTLQGYRNSLWAVSASSNTNLLASGGEDGIVRVWNSETGQRICALQGHANRVRTVAFSPTGNILASGGDDQSIRLWQVATFRCLTTLDGHSHLVRSLAFSPDGRILASGSYDQTVRLWDIGTGKHWKTLQSASSQILSVAFSPDGRLVASADSEYLVRLWDFATEVCSVTLRGHNDRIYGIAFSPDSQVMATGSDDRSVRLWDAATGQCFQQLRGHEQWVRTVAFSPDGQWLASGSHDHTIRVWRVRGDESARTLQGHMSWVWHITFSADGRFLFSASDDGTIKQWEMQTGHCLKTLIGERPYEDMDITGAQGLTESQKLALKTLGAFEH